MEYCNPGNAYRRGVGRVKNWKARWVAEISYHGKRYRMRSTNVNNCEAWLADMRVKFSD